MCNKMFEGESIPKECEKSELPDLQERGIGAELWQLQSNYVDVPYSELVGKRSRN